jgi:NAD(P)-dependent dehydrogenase (short-subunit alcohol dehydrogenase family)
MNEIALVTGAGRGIGLAAALTRARKGFDLAVGNLFHVDELAAAVIEICRASAKAGLTLLPRCGVPEKMGTIVAALASGRLPCTTGRMISADGGLLVPRF